MALSIFKLTKVTEALACAVCASNPAGSRDAFLFSTLVLTLVPLLMFALVFFLLRKKLR